MAIKYAPWTHMEYGAGNYGIKRGGSPRQFEILSRTIDAIVSDRGENGTFFINNIEETPAKDAANFLNGYNKGKGWNNIKVITSVGDYRYMRLLNTKSAHLKHPHSMVFARKYHPNLFLQKMANHSAEGLELTLSSNEFKLIHKLKEAYGLDIEKIGVGLPYISPAGKTDTNVENKRFLIKPK